MVSAHVREVKTILVVDDIQEIRDVYVRSLASFGYQVMEAESGLVALDMLRQNPIDAVLCDLWMPNMTGEQMAAKIKTLSKLQHIPIALVSAITPDIAARRLFDFVLKKPCGIDEVIAVVDQLCFA